MMTMMKYMASARAGFLGQGAARIIRSSIQLCQTAAAATAKAAADDGNAFLVCHVLLLERGYIIMLQRSQSVSGPALRASQ